MSLRLTNVQRFSTFDGPGIRTVLFTKGCTVRCPWCANPENLAVGRQFYLTGKCQIINERYSHNGGFDVLKGKKKCGLNSGYTVLNGKKKCSLNSGCAVLYGKKISAADYENCPVHGIGVYGRDWELSELSEFCLRDRLFYGREGGITVSGGEALIQAEELAGLFELMHRNHVSCCIETSLFVEPFKLEKVLPYTDYWYIDMKLLDEEKAGRIYGGNVRQYLDNLDLIFRECLREQICIRIPLVREITCIRENISRCAELLKKYQPQKCEIFSVHNLGESKYHSLGLAYHKYEAVEEELLAAVCEELSGSGVPVSINRIGE